jgi:hypothetical protein
MPTTQILVRKYPKNRFYSNRSRLKVELVSIEERHGRGAEISFARTADVARLTQAHHEL